MKNKKSIFILNCLKKRQKKNKKYFNLDGILFDINKNINNLILFVI